jgi:hypothetical protein
LFRVVVLSEMEGCRAGFGGKKLVAIGLEGRFWGNLLEWRRRFFFKLWFIFDQLGRGVVAF